MIKVGERFWQHLQDLVNSSKIVIDRPKGSVHPGFPDSPPYPVDYGYLKGTCAIDGAEVDCFVGSLGLRNVTGVMCTVDIMKKDCELKILIGCTQLEMNLAYGHLDSPSFFSACLIFRE